MKTFEQFMNEGAEHTDPYWGLFEINKVANQAVLNAVEYGYKKAEEQAQVEITRLNKMVFDLQNAAIEMAEKLKRSQYILDEIVIEDEHNFHTDQIYHMAESTVYEKIQDNLISEGPFQLVLVRMAKSFGPVMTYNYLVVRSHI